MDHHLAVDEVSALVSDHAVALFDSRGNVTSWNDGAEQLVGYDEERIVGSHYRAFFPADAREAERPERLLERARSDGAVEDEGVRVGSAGRQLWVREVLAALGDDGEIGANAGDAELAGYIWYVSDRTAEHERERALREEKAVAETVVEVQPDILYAFDAAGNLIEWNEQFERVVGYRPDELAGMDPLRFIAPADRDHIGDAIERILEEGERVTAEGRILTKDGARIPHEFNSARITGDDGIVLGFTGVGRDISERKTRERELERLERLNAIVRRIDETMVAAESRDRIETAVVEEFAAADGYCFAGIGREPSVPTSDGHSWQPAVWAGIDSTSVGDVLASFIDPPTDTAGASPFETRRVQRYQHLQESAVDEWQADARERGYGSVALVPIVATDRVFGVLVIAADDPSAFADRECEVLQEFGVTIGHAINATAIRRLLYTDSVVELEFESTDHGDACIALSAETATTIAVDHVLPLNDVFVYYLTVPDSDPDAVRDAAADLPAITELRCIDVSEAESYWEVVVRGSTISELLVGYGARLQSKVVRDGVAALTVQVSPDVDLREFVDAVTSAYPDTRLVSKRTVDRPVETRGDFRQTVESSLTEKQRLALEAAYHGGYFEWPTRNSDASEIADRLGIARQTFHQHLRVAQAKLLSAYFGASD
ncbi:bacterio-opsin activator domain-containing protein [Natrinema ejinorense]|uniref:Histidine kinase n=1 Tax=Natrinema ejinorense TaxID=373386 RepID=A0A2A5QXN5_9EURY|nr:bacterio-opsin activator domain-containing protein [Natrinema ejinorense]PCR91591.1 histidine kinase [Natrinema ejinorense]